MNSAKKPKKRGKCAIWSVPSLPGVAQFDLHLGRLQAHGGQQVLLAGRLEHTRVAGDGFVANGGRDGGARVAVGGGGGPPAAQAAVHQRLRYRRQGPAAEEFGTMFFDLISKIF